MIRIIHTESECQMNMTHKETKNKSISYKRPVVKQRKIDAQMLADVFDDKFHLSK